MIFKHFAARVPVLAVTLCLFACTEEPLIISQGSYRLNAPSFMSMVPGENIAIVSNGNINLDQTMGSLVAVDLITNKLLTDTRFDIPNFAGDFFLDTARKKIYVPNHDQALLVYNYKIPGDGGKAVSFTKVKVPVPVDNDRGYISNGILTDEGCSQALMVSGTNLGDLILVTNQRGTVSMIKASDMKYKDMDADSNIYGLRLFSSQTFPNASGFPGRGANRMTASPTTGLIYVTSPSNNQIYVLNPTDQTVEAVIDLDSISSPTVGMRDITIDNNEIAYVAHSGLDSVIVIDVSGIKKNGIPLEVIAPPILDVIAVGDGPEDIALEASGLNFFVSNQNEDSVYKVDTITRQIVHKTFLDLGKGPGRLILDEPNNVLYSLDFFSNSITRYDATTGERIGEIK